MKSLLKYIEVDIYFLREYSIFGAGEGIRTLDFNLGNDKVVASSTTLTLKLLGF